MAGIYLHIPFCRSACNYCDFHFSIDICRSEEMIHAMARELVIRKNYMGGQEIKTIYFGGGTPSYINIEYIKILLETIHTNFKIGNDPEITLEANPEDLKPGYLETLLKYGFNRISIGIQSFFDEDLALMNRPHSGVQARKAIKDAQEAGFNNLSIDLIYGFPGLTEKKWKANIQSAIEFHVEHLSAYHLTYEPGTVLYYRKSKKRITDIRERDSIKQFVILRDMMGSAGYIHYEISNFSLEGFYSRHNSNYWNQEPYLGIGPSAHSFDGIQTRQWNISKNMSYIKRIEEGKKYYETEELNTKMMYHDYVMTSLRTIRGTDAGLIKQKYGEPFFRHFIDNAGKFLESGDLNQEKEKYFLTSTGMLISDFIIRKLFI